MSEFELTTSWYALESEDDGPPYTISGVALPPDTTAFSGGENIHFPADELRKAADSLEGQSISEGHPDDYPYPVSDTIGRITRATYDGELGVVYEGVVSDDDIAQKINAGALDVSAHVMSTDDGETESGAVNAVDLKMLGLAVVSQGAAEGNSVESGPLSIDTPTPTAEPDVQSAVALALDSPTDDVGNTDVRAFTPSSAEEFAPPEGLEAFAAENRSESTGTPDGSESATEALENDLSDASDGDDRLDALEQRVKTTLQAKEDRIGELEEQVTEARQTITEFESMAETVMGVERDVSEFMAHELTQDMPVDAAEYAEAFEFEALHSQWADARESGSLGGSQTTHTATPTEPDVRSGGGRSSRSHALSSAEKQRANELREEIENLRGLADTALHQSMIDNRTDDLEELTGETYAGP